MKAIKTDKIAILTVVAAVFLLLVFFALSFPETLAKYVLGISLEHRGTVTRGGDDSGEYGFNVIDTGNDTYKIDGFIANYQNGVMKEYRPADTTLGSLIKDANGDWVLTFPSSYTIDGTKRTKLNIIAEWQAYNAFSDGFPIYNADKTIMLNSSQYNYFAVNKIVVPAGAVEIGYFAFHNYRSLKELSLPDTLTKIGDNAFEYSTSLKKVLLSGNALTAIGSNSFANCTELTTVALTAPNAYIQPSTFKGSSKLNTVFLSRNITVYLAGNIFASSPASTTIYSDMANLAEKQYKWDPNFNKVANGAATAQMVFNYSLANFITNFL